MSFDLIFTQSFKVSHILFIEFLIVVNPHSNSRSHWALNICRHYAARWSRQEHISIKFYRFISKRWMFDQQWNLFIFSFSIYMWTFKRTHYQFGFECAGPCWDLLFRLRPMRYILDTWFTSASMDNVRRWWGDSWDHHRRCESILAPAGPITPGHLSAPGPQYSGEAETCSGGN